MPFKRMTGAEMEKASLEDMKKHMWELDAVIREWTDYRTQCAVIKDRITMRNRLRRVYDNLSEAEKEVIKEDLIREVN